MYLLRKYKYDNHLNNIELGEKLGMCSQYVYMLLEGKISKIKNYEYRKKLCELLNITDDELNSELEHL